MDFIYESILHAYVKKKVVYTESKPVSAEPTEWIEKSEYPCINVYFDSNETGTTMNAMN